VYYCLNIEEAGKKRNAQRGNWIAGGAQARPAGMGGKERRDGGGRRLAIPSKRKEGRAMREGKKRKLKFGAVHKEKRDRGSHNLLF